MRTNKRLKKDFGVDEFGFIQLPEKFSNVKISRAFHGEEMGCSWCFPHRFETTNNKWAKDLKCWKRYRKRQWRLSKA